MDVQEKRLLLQAIDTLVRRPAQANEETLGIAIGYFAKLVAELTDNQMTIAPVATNTGLKS